jgi:hypothetical protein
MTGIRGELISVLKLPFILRFIFHYPVVYMALYLVNEFM